MVHTPENDFKSLTRVQNGQHLTVLLAEGMPAPPAQLCALTKSGVYLAQPAHFPKPVPVEGEAGHLGNEGRGGEGHALCWQLPWFCSKF